MERLSGEHHLHGEPSRESSAPSQRRLGRSAHGRGSERVSLAAAGAAGAGSAVLVSARVWRAAREAEAPTRCCLRSHSGLRKTGSVSPM